MRGEYTQEAYGGIMIRLFDFELHIGITTFIFISLKETFLAFSTVSFERY